MSRGRRQKWVLKKWKVHKCKANTNCTPAAEQTKKCKIDTCTTNSNSTPPQQVVTVDNIQCQDNLPNSPQQEDDNSIKGLSETTSTQTCDQKIEVSNQKTQTLYTNMT